MNIGTELNGLKSDWDIGSDESKMKQTSHPMNVVIQQFKSFVRGIHHHVSAPHIEAYLNEFCFKLNRRNFNCIFERLLTNENIFLPFSFLYLFL